jgi:hypothetical protein
MTSRCIFWGTFLAIAAIPALVSPVLAGPRDDVIAGSARCDGITDDRTWLDCYYGAAQPLRASLGLPPAPSSQQILVPPPRPNAPAPPARTNAPAAALQPGNTNSSGQPGFFARLLTHTVQKPEPPTRMTSYKFDATGYFTVTLANGETWKQSRGDSAVARWRGQPGIYVVTIMPGQDTQKMKVGDHELYDVERVR